MKTSASSGGRTARLGRNLLLLPLVLLAFVGCCELVLRLAHIGEEQIWKPDPTFGLISEPGAKFTFRSEGFSQGTYSSAGLNDREFSVNKAPGVLRIAVVGDSKTEALQVLREQSFPKLLEQSLNQSHHGRFEVMNFGVSAFSTGQEYLLYLDRVRSYHPDVLIVGYSPADNEENIKPSYMKTSAIFPRPYFSVGNKGELIVDWSVVDEHLSGFQPRLMKAMGAFYTNSRLLGLIQKTQSALGTKPIVSQLSTQLDKLLSPISSKVTDSLPAYEARPAQMLQLNRQLSSEPIKVPLAFAQHNSKSELAPIFTVTDINFGVTANILCHLKRACAADNCRLVVVSWPSLNNDIRFFRELKHMDALAKAENFSFINLQHEFPPQAPMQQSSLVFPSLHFTARGHQLAAQKIHAALAPTLFAQSQSGGNSKHATGVASTAVPL